eukprot:895602_1
MARVCAYVAALAFLWCFSLLLQYHRLYNGVGYQFSGADAPQMIIGTLNTVQIQHIVDQYIDVLSNQSYDTFNGEIKIPGNHKFQKFSMEFINRSYHQIKLLIIGDSVARGLFNFLLTQLHNYKLSKSYSNTHSVNLQLNQFRDKLSYSMSFKSNEFEYIFNPKVNKRQHMVNASKSGYWITYNKSLNWWNYENLHFWHWWNAWPNVTYMNDGNIVWKNVVNNIVHNFGGLHQLHMHPCRPYPREAIPNIVTMESYMEATIDKAAANNHIKCFIIRNTNPICHDKFKGCYKEKIKRYYAMQNLTTSQIKNLTHFQECIKEYNISVDKMYTNYSYRDHGMEFNHNQIINGVDLCSMKYTMSNFGANSLNQRMATFIKQKQIKMTTNNVSMRLIYFDGNKLLQNRCQYTTEGDGRHYNHAEPVEVIAFFNIINSYCL